MNEKKLKNLSIETIKIRKKLGLYEFGIEDRIGFANIGLEFAEADGDSEQMIRSFYYIIRLMSEKIKTKHCE